MERKCLFFQRGELSGKKQYAFVIMAEAIKTKKLSMCFEPRFLHIKKMDHLHREICKKNWSLARLFYRTYLPHNISLNKKYIFLFNEAHPSLFNLGFLDWIKKKYDVKTVLVLRNMIKNKKYPMIMEVELEKLKEVFDLIITTEENDSKLYGLVFLPNPFSMFYFKNMAKKYDICFTGENKGRIKLLTEIATKAKEKNIKYSIKIVDKERKNSPLDYVDYVPYYNILKQDIQSNCILEVLQPGQSSNTLRMEEAICLGKKLLTNNKMIKNEKYYNPKYMQIFEKVEDIDWEFVKEEIVVDYMYKGEYSPLVFLENIEAKLNNR